MLKRLGKSWNHFKRRKFFYCAFFVVLFGFLIQPQINFDPSSSNQKCKFFFKILNSIFLDPKSSKKGISLIFHFFVVPISISVSNFRRIFLFILSIASGAALNFHFYFFHFFIPDAIVAILGV
jgi:hypothetical protein